MIAGRAHAVNDHICIKTVYGLCAPFTIRNGETIFAIDSANSSGNNLRLAAVQHRRYARRQLTWLRKLPGTEVVDVTALRPEDVAARIAPA